MEYGRLRHSIALALIQMANMARIGMQHILLHPTEVGVGRLRHSVTLALVLPWHSRNTTDVSP